MVKIGGSGSYSTTTFVRRRATNLLRFADDERDDLPVVKHFLVREQNLIMAHRADIVETRHILGETDTAADACGRRAPRCIARKIFACACGEQTGQTSSIPSRAAPRHRRKSPLR